MWRPGWAAFERVHSLKRPRGCRIKRRGVDGNLHQSLATMAEEPHSPSEAGESRRTAADVDATATLYNAGGLLRACCRRLGVHNSQPPRQRLHAVASRISFPFRGRIVQPVDMITGLR